MSGCNGNGNFFCFKANTTPPVSPALAAGTVLDFDFDLTLTSGSFAGFGDDFKINWVGSKNDYDLVSKDLPFTPVPAPLIGHGLPILIAVGGLLFGAKLLERSKKHRPLSPAVPNAAA